MSVRGIKLKNCMKMLGKMETVKRRLNGDTKQII